MGGVVEKEDIQRIEFFLLDILKAIERIEYLLVDDGGEEEEEAE